MMSIAVKNFLCRAKGAYGKSAEALVPAWKLCYNDFNKKSEKEIKLWKNCVEPLPNSGRVRE